MEDREKINDGTLKGISGKTAETLHFMNQLQKFASVANFEINDNATSTEVANQVESVDYVELCRQRLKKIMAQTRFGCYYENVLLFLSIASCLEYIYQTYLSFDDDRPELNDLAELEIFFAFVFTFDWCLNCFLAEHRLIFFTRYLCSQ